MSDLWRAFRECDARIAEIQWEHRSDQQFGLVDRFFRRIEPMLSPAPSASVVFLDTSLYFWYDKRIEQIPDQFYASWIAGGLDYILARNEALNLHARRSVAYRYMILPCLSAIRSEARELFRRAVLFNVHLQLWHGVVLGVVFADPTLSPPKIVNGFDVIHVPRWSRMLYSPEFYSAPGQRIIEDAGLVVLDRSRAFKAFLRSAVAGPIWLWYNDEHFGPNKLRGGAWQKVERLIKALYDDPFVCPACHEERPITVNHTAPWSRDRRQTMLNFDALCDPCNKKRGTRPPAHDPFAMPPFVPKREQSQALAECLQHAPSWLGNIARPADTREIGSLLKALGMT